MSGPANWRTPPDFFEKLHAEFGFTLDAAASDENALLGRDCGYAGDHCDEHQCWTVGRYFTEEDDAISQDWTGERVWCNPPYSPASLLYAFIEKCANHGRLVASPSCS